MGSLGALAGIQPQGQMFPPTVSIPLMLPATLVPRMASGRARCTRKLRNWVVEQVESGQFPGVCWDDAAKTMFRIPWKHAGKQDFREDQDAAFFKVKEPGKQPLRGKGGVYTEALALQGLCRPGFQRKRRWEGRTSCILDTARYKVKVQKL